MNKRMLADKIGIFFLLKQQRLVTRRELTKSLPLQQYEDYCAIYYRRRASSVFDKNLRREWFVFRYLQDLFWERRLGGILGMHSFEQPGLCIVARDIPGDVPGDIVCAAAAKCLNVDSFWILQRTSQNGFSRTCYIILKSGSSATDSIEFMKSVVDRGLRFVFEEFDVSGVEEPVVLCEERDDKQAALIFGALCRMYRLDERQMLQKYATRCGVECRDARFMCNALKDVFLYCYVCAHQYDHPVEMMMGCKNHKMTEAASRRREFLSNYQHLDFLKTRGRDEELEKMVKATHENHYQCELCGKAFEGKRFALNHLSNKHPEEIERTQRDISDFERFVDRIDCFILGFVEGTDDDCIPGFISLDERDKRVVYDTGHIFSGEVVIEK